MNGTNHFFRSTQLVCCTAICSSAIGLYANFVYWYAEHFAVSFLNVIDFLQVLALSFVLKVFGLNLLLVPCTWFSCPSEKIVNLT